MGFDLASMLGLKEVLPIAGLAAKFIPGAQALSPILTGLGGLVSAGQNDKKQKGILNTLQGNVDSQNEMYQKYFAPLLEQMSSQVTNFNPGSYIDPRYRASVESAGRLADSEIARSALDYGGRGIMDSSGMNSATANARAKVGAAGEGAARQYGMEAQQFQAQQRGNLAQLLTGMNSNTMGSLGGLQGMYASRQGGVMDALGQIGDLYGQSQVKLPGTPPINPNRGNSTLSTNQAPSAGFSTMGSYNPYGSVTTPKPKRNLFGA